MKKLLALTLLGSAAAMACSVETATTGEETSSGSEAWTTDELCKNPWVKKDVAKYEAEASLAVAAIDEMGDLEVHQNFKIGSNWGLEITTSPTAGGIKSGEQKCADRGKVLDGVKCPNTKAILSLQFQQGGFPELEGFRNILVTHFQRYNDARTNQTWTGCVGTAGNVGSLSAAGTTGGICAASNSQSFMYWYTAQNPGKLYCKTIAFGGALAPTHNPENPFMIYQSNGTVEGFDPYTYTPAPVPLAQAANAVYGNLSPVIGRVPYTLAATPGVTYVMRNAVSGQYAWENVPCNVNGVAGTYKPHPLLGATHLQCKPN